MTSITARPLGNPAAAAGPPPVLKQIQVTVPEKVAPQYAQIAVQLGVQIMEAVKQGVCIISFPQVSRGPDGKAAPGLGQFAMPVVAKEDVERLLKLVENTNRANDAVLKARASGNQADELTTTIQANKLKANTDRVVESDIHGGKGIIVA